MSADSRKLDPDQEQLCLDLKAIHIESIPDEFFSCLDQAFACYEYYSEPEESVYAREPNEKKELDKIYSQVKKLENSIENLSNEAYDIVTLEGNILDSIRTVCGVIETNKAIYPGRGRPFDYNRLELAVGVAGCVEKHLGVKPTGTKEGAYEKVLVFALGRLTSKEVSAVNDLAVRALCEIKNIRKSRRSS